MPTTKKARRDDRYKIPDTVAKWHRSVRLPRAIGGKAGTGAPPTLFQAFGFKRPEPPTGGKSATAAPTR